jgi:hypothetical protein|tara:strand:+ start:6906 stop:7202 length:297 start_codon:yes stop_codon:yes gene_type:complete
MIRFRRNYQGDTWYLGDYSWKRSYCMRYIGQIGMFQIGIRGACLSFMRKYATNWKYWSNKRVFYWVVPHTKRDNGATHSVGLYWIEVTLVLRHGKGKI